MPLLGATILCLLLVLRVPDIDAKSFTAFPVALPKENIYI